ncbi:AAA family ATPase [Tenacibaculum maritimum]|uniref:AAA family ATPase n=1 Tax=Tenacibaculum maritimum TaxID=107401 RepID=UPI0038769FBC
MSKGNNNQNRSKNSRNNFKNRPFEDKLRPFITADIDKKINDLFSQSVRKIRAENTEFKKEVQNLIEQIENEKINQKISDLENELKQIDDNSELDEIKLKLKDLTELSLKYKKDISLLKRKCLPFVNVKINESKPSEVGIVHYQFEELIAIVSTGLNVFLTGPAGSGKTTAANQCAKALNIDFYFTGAIASEFKLTGFIDANGKIVSTEFRKAYEEGGLFLFDEIDGSFPQAVLAFNAALANDYMDFPDKRVKRHKNFYCIAAANTYGQGADRQYVGRNQLDAASIDRFIFTDWKYDETLERKLANNDKWVDYVQSIRRIIEKKEIRHIVSPRASFYGAKLLKNNLNQELVESSVIWKGLDNATIELIKNNL